jgi:probable addiction module antidote protein
MPVEFKPLDISELLDSEEMIAGFLSAAAEDEDPDVLIGALMHAAKARGMMQVAKATGLNRESLYKALKPGAHPRFETVQAVLRALGVKLSLAARQATDDPGRDGDEMRRLEKVAENKILQPVEKRRRGRKGRALSGRPAAIGKANE